MIISTQQARAVWLQAQGLHERAPFGKGASATAKAVHHLGYVQIDTINVIERSHHHILYTRIPSYTRGDLTIAQSIERSVFEYWAHALAYIGISDYKFFVPAMDAVRRDWFSYFSDSELKEYKALIRRIKKEGPLSIRDISDEVMVEKTHPWGSRKPSKQLLNYGFFAGELTISKRTGMLKTYDLSAQHFGWFRRPKPATNAQFVDYLLRRAIRSQGIISVDSVCYGNIGAKAAVKKLIEAAVRRRQLISVHIEGHPKIEHWIQPEILENISEIHRGSLVHILSPFDPLVIQRKRLRLFFNYEHRFEAYIPLAKRLFGYFALPILVGDEIAAVIDFKADRRKAKLLVQKWTWLVEQRSGLKPAIDEALHRFERFQLS